MNFISIKKVLFFFLVLMNGFAFAQGISIGSWRDHLSYGNCTSVTEGNGVIYCATENALFYYNLEDHSLNRLTKVEGLTDINVSTINFSKKYNTLIIAYNDCNLDLMINNQILNISDIKRKNIIGNKVINRIDFIDKYAYLSCGFGIVVIDLIKKEIKDTYYIGKDGAAMNIFDVSTDGTKLFAATENGIYFASLNNPNISDYNAWMKDTLISKNNNQYNYSKMFKGLDIIKDTTIEAHYSERNRQKLLDKDLKESGVKYGLGIDCVTAIEFKSGEFPKKYKKIGTGNIYIKNKKI